LTFSGADVFSKPDARSAVRSHRLDRFNRWLLIEFGCFLLLVVLLALFVRFLALQCLGDITTIGITKVANTSVVVSGFDVSVKIFVVVGGWGKS
jgi:hypothetical protein